MKNMIARGVFMACLMSGIVVATELPAQAATTVRGHVQCASGAEVVGVWVDASTSKDGWAKVTYAGMPSYKRFTFSLSRGGTYSVHVGCGWKKKPWWQGGGKVWATNNKSRFVRGSRSFLCYDVKTRIPRGMSHAAYQKCFD